MCGIAGYIGKKKISFVKKNELLNLMQNRGPDSTGHKFITDRNNSINLFFTRLAIIAPEKNSNQPYSYKDKTLFKDFFLIKKSFFKQNFCVGCFVTSLIVHVSRYVHVLAEILPSRFKGTSKWTSIAFAYRFFFF